MPRWSPPQLAIRGRRGPSDCRRTVPEPGLLVLPGRRPPRLRVISDRSDAVALAFAVDYGALAWAGRDTFSRRPRLDGTRNTPTLARWTRRQRLYGLRWSSTAGSRADGSEPGALAGLMADRRGGPKRLFRRRGPRRSARDPRRRAGRTFGSPFIRCNCSRSRAGENAGHTLPYVVREMVLLGHWRGEAATFPLPGASDQSSAGAAIVQVLCGPVLAAAKP